MGFNKGEKHFNWKGGRTLGKGYYYILMPEHPSSNKDGYVSEHRLVIEAFFGRILSKEWEVHHKDKNTLNNRIDNLQLLTKSDHTSLHSVGRIVSEDAKNKMRNNNNSKGEKNGSAKLTSQNIREIRASKKSIKELAIIYNMSISHLYKIINNKLWKNI